MSISTIRAILEKFKATGAVTNLPGRGPMLILPPHTLRRMIRKETEELQKKVASWGH